MHDRLQSNRLLRTILPASFMCTTDCCPYRSKGVSPTITQHGWRVKTKRAHCQKYLLLLLMELKSPLAASWLSSSRPWPLQELSPELNNAATAPPRRRRSRGRLKAGATSCPRRLFRWAAAAARAPCGCGRWACFGAAVCPCWRHSSGRAARMSPRAPVTWQVAT